MTLERDYPWMESYSAALLETDPAKLRTLLPIALHELQARKLVLNSTAAANHHGERADLEDALRILRIVEKELARP